MSLSKVKVSQEAGKFKFQCYLKSLVTSQGFTMSSKKYSEVEDFINEFLSIFADVDKDGNKLKKLQMLQKNTEHLRKNFNEFCERYKSHLPEIQGLISFFKKTGENNNFVILPSEELTPKLFFDLNTYLKSLSGEKSYEELKKESDELFQYTLDNFHIRGVGAFRTYIGNPKKEERVCRFCRKKIPESKFNQRAHAISEALGNKNIILFDECDSCNEKFGTTIEVDIITYLSLFRTFYNVLGKGGKKKIKGRNFELTNEDKIELKFWDINDRPKKGDAYNLILDFGKDVNFQNIYKSLTKFFLSIIDDDQLEYFEHTIDWINGNVLTEQLPNIAELITYDFFSQQPKIFYYLRKSDDFTLPYAICDFHFTCMRMVYIIPFSSRDNCDFNNQVSWPEIFENFKHFDVTRGWNFTNFSSTEKNNLLIKLNTEVEKKAIN